VSKLSLHGIQNYREVRTKKGEGYQPIPDQMDAIMEGFEAIIKDGRISVPQSIRDAVKSWRDVKIRIPKTPKKPRSAS